MHVITTRRPTPSAMIIAIQRCSLIFEMLITSGASTRLLLSRPMYGLELSSLCAAKCLHIGKTRFLIALTVTPVLMFNSQV